MWRYGAPRDAQQNVIIRRVTRDLGMPVRHLLVPTVRAPDGLALSSRNRHLSPEERAQATALYAGLAHAAGLWADGEVDAEALRAAVRATLRSHPLVSLEYVSLSDPDTLEELHIARAGDLLSLAAHVGRTRLIDNVTLG